MEQFQFTLAVTKFNVQNLSEMHMIISQRELIN